MKKPIIAIVGRPNVGKSTLFNSLTRTRNSLVSDIAGLTRDRNYGDADLYGLLVTLVDTGGLFREEESQIDFRVDEQAKKAIDEATAIIFVVDGQEGLTAVDEDIAQELRRAAKPTILTINKTDFADPNVIASDFYRLGFKNTISIAAVHKRGLHQLADLIKELLPEDALSDPKELQPPEGIVVAVLGRPNAGKSTLLNRLLGENRLVSSPIAGTTRDSIYIPYIDGDGSQFTLVDTAGIRRKSRVYETVEKFSIIKALEAVEKANVVILMLDAHEGISDQDAHLLGEITKRGRGLVIAINKWDNLNPEDRKQIEQQFARKLNFVDYAETFYISALHGSNIRSLLPAAKRAYQSARAELPTKALTEALELAYRKHQPPLVNGRSIKMQYAHQGGRNPPHIIIHGTRTINIPASYEQYLAKFFRRHFKLNGTPIRISFRDKHNPYITNHE